MAVSVRSTVSTTHNAQVTYTPSGMPSGWLADDIGVFIANGNSNVGISTAPSGWTQVIAAFSDSLNDVKVVVYVKRLVGGETVPSLDWGGTQSGGCVLLAIQGVPTDFDLTTFGTLNMVKTASLGSITAGQNLDVSAPDVPAGGGLELTGLTMDLSGPGSTYTQPSGFTKTITDFDSTSNVLIGVAHKVDSNPDLQTGGTLSWTSTASDSPAVWSITFPAQSVIVGTYSGHWGSHNILVAGGAPDPASLLKYAPLSTAGWTVVNIPAGTNRYSYTGTGSNNVVFQMPASVRGGIVLKNLANFVLIGGAISIDNSSAPDPTQVFGAQRRGVEVQNLSGIGHLEGLDITHNSDIASQGDAFYFTLSPGGDIRIQNCRVPMIYGQFDRSTGGDHGDVIQVYGGAANGLGTLRLDKLTYKTVYQGGPGVFDQSLDAMYIDRVDAQYDNTLAGAISDHKGGGILALNGPPPIVTVNNYWLREVRNNADIRGVIDTNGSWSATNGANPAESATYTHPSVNGGSSPAFTYSSSVTEYVPSGVAGIAYTSPGYQ